jgi:hypothetical protein
MTDKKLSQLPGGTAIQVADLFYSAQAAGGGLYTSVYQPWSAILAALGGIGGTLDIQTPVTGFSITIGNGVGDLVLEPASMLGSGTITMAPSPTVNKVGIRSTQPISVLTINPNAGQTVKAAPITLAAGQKLEAIYNSGTATWYFGM